jgi:hypothetical protein
VIGSSYGSSNIERHETPFLLVMNSLTRLKETNILFRDTFSEDTLMVWLLKTFLLFAICETQRENHYIRNGRVFELSGKHCVQSLYLENVASGMLRYVALGQGR